MPTVEAHQHQPQVAGVGRALPSGLEERACHHVAEQEQGGRRRDHEEGESRESGVEPGAQLGSHRIGAPHRRAHGRELAGGDGHPEEADGEQVQDLLVAEGGQAARAHVGRVDRVEKGRELDHPASDQGGDEVVQHRPHRGAGRVERRAEGRAEQRQRGGELHRHLRHRAGHVPPGDPSGDAGLLGQASGLIAAHGPARQGQRRDHRPVQHHRGGVGEEEAPVAVQHPQAPGGEDQGAGGGEEDAHQSDGQRVIGPGQPRRDHRHDEGRRQHAGRHQRGRGGGQEPAHRPRHAIGLLLLAPGQQVRVDGDERAREDALAQQVLEQVGDPQRGVEHAGDRPAAQVVGEDPLPDEPADARQEDAARHQDGVPAAPPGVRRPGGRASRRCGGGRAHGSRASAA